MTRALRVRVLSGARPPSGIASGTLQCRVGRAGLQRSPRIYRRLLAGGGRVPDHPHPRTTRLA
jgi:hypothetical protein